MGTRLLRYRILQPSFNVSKLIEIQDATAALIERDNDEIEHVRKELKSLAKLDSTIANVIAVARG